MTTGGFELFSGRLSYHRHRVEIESLSGNSQTFLWNFPTLDGEVIELLLRQLKTGRCKTKLDCGIAPS
jgi:hypothetical protein